MPTTWFRGTPTERSTSSPAIDLAGTTGHSLAWLAGYGTPLTLSLGGGQVLLANVADPQGELLQQPSKGGALVQYDLLIPSDLTFFGFRLATQALHFGGMQPFSLSNAQDLVLGL